MIIKVKVPIWSGYALNPEHCYCFHVLIQIFKLFVFKIQKNEDAQS